MHSRARTRVESTRARNTFKDIGVNFGDRQGTYYTLGEWFRQNKARGATTMDERTIQECKRAGWSCERGYQGEKAFYLCNDAAPARARQHLVYNNQSQTRTR